ncbi:MAG: hypothetical protein JST93_32085 [Acidobacteria bacterium]|nr:hypothetical protein [Acidobacteriota bacterium]
MSISETHSDAARQNGHAGHGPISEAGKQRSAQNARKHDFFTNIAVLPDEDREDFIALLADFSGEHQPTTPTERRCIHEMADAEFRLRRIRLYIAQAQCKQVDMNNLSHTPMADAFQKLAESGPTLPLCLRYEKHFQRQFESALKMLFTLRKNAPKPQAAPKPETKSKEVADIALRLRVLERMILDPSFDEEPQPEIDEDFDLQNEPTSGL